MYESKQKVLEMHLRALFKGNSRMTRRKCSWKEALRQAANLSGHTFKDEEYEATFIDNIVDGILIQVLNGTYWNVAKYPVEIQSHVQDVKKLLDVGGNGCRMVGIWGTSGVGKTAIAKAIWNAIAHEFEGSCFLENVREGSLVQLQKTLLHKYLGKKLKIQSVDEGIGVIKKRLRYKKILLILDDVDHLEQLENLAGDDWFGKGSRVIITTKDRGLLENHGIELIYKVKKLDSNQALELFSWHAFGRSEPPKDYLELAQRAIAFADGLPLALTILGSHLCNRGIRRWQVILDDYKGEPYTHIERILQKSYDALDDDAKEGFLDIACFFKGEYKDYVVQIVPQNCIEVLVDKAMITVEWDKRILMHDLLEKLGKDIVHKESPNDPDKRSRLWFYEDVNRVLTESRGTRKIKGILVKLPKSAEITLNPECFCNMVNLQIFINRNAFLCGDINYLPNALRFIDWPSCQLQSLPPKFQGYCLVEFRMPRSHIRQLEGFRYSPNLTCMNLRGCQFLEKIPDLSGIPNIKYLFLSDCTSLVELDDSVGFLDKLVDLDLSGCVNLTRFGRRLRLKSLETLELEGCESLESFPEIEVKMESLRRLDMEGSGIRELPPSIKHLTGLGNLILERCFNLTRLELRLLHRWSTFMNSDDCMSLREIPQEVLPPRLPPSSEVEFRRLSLMNCERLRGYDITENSILDQVSSLPHSEFEITLLGDEVPKWFSCCKDATLVKDEYSSDEEEEDEPGDEVPKWFSCYKDATLVKDEYSSDEEEEDEYSARCEVCFEIPPNLDWETLRLVICVVNKGNVCGNECTAVISVHINGEWVGRISMGIEDSNVGLSCIPLLNLRNRAIRWGELTPLQQGNKCQIIFEFRFAVTPVKILCGVHLLGHQVADVSIRDWSWQEA